MESAAPEMVVLSTASASSFVECYFIVPVVDVGTPGGS